MEELGRNSGLKWGGERERFKGKNGESGLWEGRR